MTLLFAEKVPCIAGLFWARFVWQAVLHVLEGPFGISSKVLVALATFDHCDRRATPVAKERHAFSHMSVLLNDVDDCHRRKKWHTGLIFQKAKRGEKSLVIFTKIIEDF